MSSGKTPTQAGKKHRKYLCWIDYPFTFNSWSADARSLKTPSLKRGTLRKDWRKSAPGHSKIYEYADKYVFYENDEATSQVCIVCRVCKKAPNIQYSSASTGTINHLHSAHKIALGAHTEKKDAWVECLPVQPNKKVKGTKNTLGLSSSDIDEEFDEMETFLEDHNEQGRSSMVEGSNQLTNP